MSKEPSIWLDDHVRYRSKPVDGVIYRFQHHAIPGYVIIHQYEEAADALGISRQAVGSRLNRARRKLRFALEGSDNHESA